jgi:hypothetical protein
MENGWWQWQQCQKPKERKEKTGINNHGILVTL